MNTLTLKIKQLTKSYRSKTILDINELFAYQDDVIGIVGDNGSGKSTLLQLIAGEIEPDSGTVHREVNFNYFKQVEKVDEQYRAADLDPELIGRLNIPTNDVQTLSGGEISKYRIAQTLSIYKMGLLLDEPTTHLDRKSIQFLIDELKYYYGTLIVVSHDRYFLNQLATKIWEVKDGKVTEYPGNYTDYQKQKEHAAVEQQASYEKYQQEKKQLEKTIRHKKQQAQKAGKATGKQKKQQIKPDRLSSSKQKDTVQKAMHKSAKAAEKRMEQLEEVKSVESKRTIHFPQPKELKMHNDFPVMGEHVTIQRGDNLLLDAIDFQFALEKTIAIVGNNGTGKSTLLDHIEKDREGIRLSPKVVFSTYQQMAYHFNQKQTLVHFLLEQTTFDESFVRAILNQLGFNQNQINTELSNLSGGEATKIALALLFVKPSNVLILDEPTNFIDLSTIQALETFILNYPGTVLLTSHDKTFVERVADQIFEIKNQKLELIYTNEII